VLGVLLVAADAVAAWGLRASFHAKAFLSQLLTSLPPTCQAVRNDVVWARLVGEPVAFFLGMAMTATVRFRTAPTDRELSLRYRSLKHLL
jgi:hypothetical protein